MIIVIFFCFFHMFPTSIEKLAEMEILNNLSLKCPIISYFQNNFSS